MATNDTTPTILPAEPWYTSPVQRAQVFASLSGIAALVIQLLDLQVDVAMINVKIGIVAQIVNVGFGLWGILKRSSSEIQPLTLTKAGADAKAPAAITTVDEIKSQGGFARVSLLAVLAIAAAGVLSACTTTPSAVFNVACDTAQPNYALERCAKSVTEIYEVYQKRAEDVANDPSTPRGVVEGIQAAEGRVTPVVLEGLKALSVFTEAKAQLAGGATDAERLAIAERNLSAWVEQAMPLVWSFGRAVAGK